MTRAVSVLLLAGLAACGSDRERPGLVSPDTPLQIAVQIVAPRTSETVEAGRNLSIQISAFETFKRLEGLGVVIHRFNSPGVLDSTVVRFQPTTDTVITFNFRVPPTLPTNAQLDIRGIAFGPDDQWKRTPGVTVIVLACPPNAEWCT